MNSQNIQHCISYGLKISYHSDKQFPTPYAMAHQSHRMVAAVSQTDDEAVEKLVNRIREEEQL